MANISDRPTVLFDDFSKLRILDPADFEASESLKEECKGFTTRLNNFNEVVQMFLQLMEEKAQQIEKEKLKAIGLRNKYDHEVENRKGKQLQLNSIINERQAELDRYVTLAARSLTHRRQG
ncbi:intraflagellar transport protein 20 [Gaertneriomyces semiglobifer]|nr:intraflagellar transport protein 20 [Gaertneriomyces semiglobifer]